MPTATESAWASTVVVGSITGIALTADWLPHRVAGHFAVSGLANGFVAREVYVALLIGAAVLVPALTVALLWLAVRRYPRLVNLPNSGYWLADERRDQTAEFLATRAIWLAAILALFALSLHLLVLRANHLDPVRLEPVALLAVVVAFVVALVAWLSRLHRHFEQI